MEDNNKEPSTAPEPGRWYDLRLGQTFKDELHSHHPPKFCTFRYEFKPASIDNSQPGLLHKGKDNRVTVEFQNNHQGKPKVIFEGVSEDYRGNDAVMFFDGETFQLERLGRAVKRLRRVRIPGDPSTAAVSTMATLAAPALESHSPAVDKGSKVQQPLNTDVIGEAVQMEQIDVGNSDCLGAQPKSEKDEEHSSSFPNPSILSPDHKNYELEEDVDIVDDNSERSETAKRDNSETREARTGLDIDINLPHQMDMDDEIADVDISDDEADKGPNAAEALRAQVNAEVREAQTSSSSSSGSSSSSSSDSDSDSSETGSETAGGNGGGSASTSSDSEVVMATLSPPSDGCNLLY